MPTIDRKPRARRRTSESSANAIASEAEFQALVWDTAKDEDAWRTVRTRAARYLLAKGAGIRDADDALAMADAYHRAPHWLPLLHPIGPNSDGVKP